MDWKESCSSVYKVGGVLFFVMYLARAAFGQVTPNFKSLRYDEDYSAVKVDSLPNFYWRLKHLALTKGSRAYLSLGGEARYQYFKIENEDWGDTPESSDGFLLARYLVHSDLHLGARVRVFGQLQSSLAAGKLEVSPVDENPFELHQLFVDYSTNSILDRKMTFRVGRQEMLYGSQRLISVREGPNNRQSFDAIKYVLTMPTSQLDLFYSHFVEAESGILNDGFGNSRKLWGSYWSVRQRNRKDNLDVYYLGFWKRISHFDDGSGEEFRNSVGLRLWNSQGKFTYDIEGVYQFGKVGNTRISAWTISSKIVYELEQKLKPRVGIKMEVISGDRRYDDLVLNTFNPMFPNGGYFGLAALFGPLNLVDFHPSLALTLTNRIAWNFDYDIFWRSGKTDGLYTIGGNLIYSGRNNPHYFIGHQFSNDIRYRPCSFLVFKAEFKWFLTGSFLKAAGTGEDILFTLLSVQCTF